MSVLMPYPQYPHRFLMTEYQLFWARWEDGMEIARVTGPNAVNFTVLSMRDRVGLLRIFCKDELHKVLVENYNRVSFEYFQSSRQSLSFGESGK